MMEESRRTQCRRPEDYILRMLVKGCHNTPGWPRFQLPCPGRAGF